MVNYKEFFKPEAKKFLPIILFVFIPTVFETTLYASGCLSPEGLPQSELYISEKCLENNFLKYMNYYVMFSWALELPAFIFISPLLDMPDFITFPISVLVFSAYWYLIACIICWIYKKKI